MESKKKTKSIRHISFTALLTMIASDATQPLNACGFQLNPKLPVVQF